MGRDRSRWHRITRSQAVKLCRIHRVAVMFQNAGQDAASWFEPMNRFFRSDSPYSYADLRYFLLIGGGAGSDWANAMGMGMTSKPETVDLEPLEFEDQSTGEMRSLGSPTSKVPKTPVAPNQPDLTSIPTQPSPPGPGAAGLEDIPDLPTLKGFAIPVLQDIPGTPESALGLSTEKKEPIPIEYRLLDPKGNPMPPTAFRVTLPDGTVKTGKSDADGFIRIPDNTQPGQSRLELQDPEETDPAKIAAFANPKANVKKVPIEIKLVDTKGEPLADKPFRIKLPDGTNVEGKSDGEGLIRLPDNTQTGDLELVLTEFEKKEA